MYRRRVRFLVLGPLEARRDGQELQLGRGRPRALLSLLLIHRGEVVSSERLIDELWSGSPPASAAKVVQQYVSQLRRVLPAGTIVTRGSGYLLDACETDAGEFEQLVDDASDQEPQQAARTLRAALALWRGRPYADFEYEAWAQAEVGRLEELRLVAQEERIEADLQLSEPARLVPELEALVAQHPLRERMRAQLMLALYRSGRQAEALEVFADGRKTLVDELGIEPGPELQDLQRRILAQDPTLGPPRRTQPLASIARRGKWLVVAGAALLAAAAAAGGWEIAHGSGGRSATAGGSSVVVLDPQDGRFAGRIPLAETPASLAVAADSLWALSTADKTIARIDPTTRKVVQTFTTTGVPTDLAVGSGALWVVNGGGSEAGGMLSSIVPTSVSRLDLRSGVATRAIPLRRGSRPIVFERKTGVGAIAIARDAVWAIDASGAIDRIDPARRKIVATVTGLPAEAIAASGNDVWIDDGGTTVARIDAHTNRITTRISVGASGLDGIALGDGAIWVADSQDGEVWRIDPGPPVVTKTIPVSIGVSSLSVGDGALWAANPSQGTISRIDPSTDAVRTVSLGGTAEASTAGEGATWVSVNPVAKGLQENGIQALPATACSPPVTGGGNAQFLIASDLDLRGSAVTKPMTQAIELVLQQHGFRAGRYTVGYQSCDDSTAQVGGFDFATCGANAQADAADPSLIGVIGPINSPCVFAELPIISKTPSGPLAMISTLATYTNLTHRSQGFTPGLLHLLYPTGRRDFVRIVASDDVQGAADAELGHELGLARVYVLDDEGDYGRDLSGGFLHAARRLGLRIAGVSPWSEQARTYTALADRIRRSRATGVFLAGYVSPGTGHLIRTLRARLGPKVTLIAGDGFLDIPTLLQVTGPTATGMYVSLPGRPNEQLPLAGRRFVDAFATTQGNPHVTSYAAAYAAQATELLLGAIAHSDGTRASVTKQLFASKIRNGILGSFVFTPGGDMNPAPVTIFHVVGGNRPSSTYLPDYRGAVVNRVVDVPAGLAR